MQVVDECIRAGVDKFLALGHSIKDIKGGASTLLLI